MLIRIVSIKSHKKKYCRINLKLTIQVNLPKRHHPILPIELFNTKNLRVVATSEKRPKIILPMGAVTRMFYCSWVMLHSVNNSINKQNLESYLKSCWEFIQSSNSTNLPPTVIHIRMYTTIMNRLSYKISRNFKIEK